MKTHNIIARCLGSLFFGWLCVINWQIALCIFMIMWADNIDKHWGK